MSLCLALFVYHAMIMHEVKTEKGSYMVMITIVPEAFDIDLHELPTAGELLLTGAKVTINADGVAFNASDDALANGVVIEVTREGEVVEIAVMGEQQDDGGFYFEGICVMQVSG